MIKNELGVYGHDTSIHNWKSHHVTYCPLKGVVSASVVSQAFFTSWRSIYLAKAFTRVFISWQERGRCKKMT